ncbi:uncharacterized protein MKK02DRAFT_39311 [Dioszegia hungarica]|uniref:5-formyltetrahydrofolate cyclo-ligase n=1 Tax=Dioszegia hungarica TaxID=4972 RepID=A0AA38LU26_9TREE|nr:uncharacterized protein MKK02DRAFT_39311 [Dioszegia hungarica]KAI9633331.1 hypothetical protein MKK02DRAFT_39311 [Dioszegia hungarica]
MFALKAALRKSMLKALRQISEQELKAQSDAVFRSLLQQDWYTSARSVGCYLSMAKGELQTDQIVQDLLKRGAKLYTPYLPPPPSAPAPSPSSSDPPISATSEMRMLSLYSPADLEACPLDKWGILDPGETRRDTGEKREDAMDHSAPDLDLILIPGVAFDEHCNRLGRGKAFYDRYLANYTSTRKRPLFVALGLSVQLLPAGEMVPITTDDFTLDGVITPDRTIWRRGTKEQA